MSDNKFRRTLSEEEIQKQIREVVKFGTWGDAYALGRDFNPTFTIDNQTFKLDDTDHADGSEWRHRMLTIAFTKMIGEVLKRAPETQALTTPSEIVEKMAEENQILKNTVTLLENTLNELMPHLSEEGLEQLTLKMQSVTPQQYNNIKLGTHE